MENSDSNKELDLIDIIKICWGWFVKYICKPLIFCIKYIIRKWWVGLLAIIIGFSIAYTTYKLSPKYVGEMILKNNVCTSSDFVSDIRSMSKTSAQFKATALGIPLAEANQLKAIWGHQLCYLDSTQSNFVVDTSDSLASQGFAALKNSFAIEVMASDTIAFKHLEKGVENYFNNNPYYSQQNQSRLISETSLIQRVEKEISAIDSSRTDWEHTVLVSSLSTIEGEQTTIISPTDVSREIIDMNKLAIVTKNNITYSPEVVSVISHLKYNICPTNHFLKTWKKYVFLSLLICYVLAFCISYRKKIIEIIQK